MTVDRIEAAYWLALAFALTGERRRDKNGLVCVAQELGLGILDLVGLDGEALPEALRPYGVILERFQGAEGQVSGLAFLVDDLLSRGIAVVPITSVAYPEHLRQSLGRDHAPTVLTVAGDVGILAERGACVSGSRKAGAHGLAFARACGAALAEGGVSVVTGLAAGPDREALGGCLEAGGRAIGVAPEGLLQSRAPRDPSVRTGHLVVVSEFHPKQAWQAGLAMARNRTLAGLSRALFVADCVAEGGTTNQVEVHAKVGMPIYLRRGTGEGPWVDTLAKQSTVTSFPWEGGSVALPEGWASTPKASPVLVDELRDRRASLHDEIGVFETRIAKHRAEIAALDAQIVGRRAEISAIDAQITERAATRPLPVAVAREPDVTSHKSKADQGDVGTVLLAALRGAAQPRTVAELVSDTGLSETKVRKGLGALVDEKAIQQDKVGRSVRYSVYRTLTLFSTPPEMRG